MARNIRLVVPILVPMLFSCATSLAATTNRAEHNRLECAPFARAISGVDLHGDAYTWWQRADGHYARSLRPSIGSVLVFRQAARLPHGHVAVVSRVVSKREIVVTQANWVHRHITRDHVVDQSPTNDWTAVRVSWSPSNQLGTAVFRTYGFIAAPTSWSPNSGD
jgi:hypothetical protein